MTLTERLTRVDPEMLEYRATVNDPLTYTAPLTVRMMWTTQPGYEIYEYSCHEANRAVSGGLGGERNYEQRVREAVSQGRATSRAACRASRIWRRCRRTKRSVHQHQPTKST